MAIRKVCEKVQTVREGLKLNDPLLEQFLLNKIAACQEGNLQILEEIFVPTGAPIKGNNAT